MTHTFRLVAEQDYASIVRTVQNVLDPRQVEDSTASHILSF